MQTVINFDGGWSAGIALRKARVCFFFELQGRRRSLEGEVDNGRGRRGGEDPAQKGRMHIVGGEGGGRGCWWWESGGDGWKDQKESGIANNGQ